MSTSPLSSAEAARQSVAKRLRNLRKDAGLTTQGLADLCGWNKSKTSRIENVRTTPSDADIRAWCMACNARELAADLVAASRDAESMYVQWRGQQRTGMRRLVDVSRPLYQSTSLFRIYCSNVMPGLLQAESYAQQLLSDIADFRQVPNDSAAAAAARFDRAQIIRDGLHRVVLLVEESVLRRRDADDAAMAGQLGYLLTAMSYPAVSLGIIPQSARRTMWGVEQFSIFDDKRVHVELMAGKVTLTSPGDVDVYLRAFEQMRQMAVYGPEARLLINAAIDSLG
ncbi:helix-turn-helix transcriptional regulator [Streptomyces sp. 71268]|uniref:helix-turn-helix domain-containing protein n=1 Tax=Streptomyces sp. 71268 TaxID=3002640 RepID=UPI0023FA4712|nr:helix-turn-helix transcriptional regulator [Streptomyces sp. 71268]WEV28651.1 helix-turn-helix transcriptional regulator [Streptomyces sp. 71268]